MPSECLSMRQQWFAHARLLVAHLTRSRPGLFPERSPPRLFTSAASGGLGSPPARRARRAKPPSLAQHGSSWRPSPSPPLSFLHTRTPGHIAPMTPANGTTELMTPIHDAP